MTSASASATFVAMSSYTNTEEQKRWIVIDEETHSILRDVAARLTLTEKRRVSMKEVALLAVRDLAQRIHKLDR